MCTQQDNNLYEEKDIKQVLNVWLARIGHIKQCTQIENNYDAFDIAYLMWPLIEVISFTLYKSGPRKYLEKLGLSSSLANLVIEAYRNGYAHSNNSYVLEYNNGSVIPGELTSKSTGDLRPWEDDEVFLFYDGNNVSISWDRLLSCIEADILNRKSEVTYFDKIDYVIGKKVDSDKPSIKEANL